MASLADGRRTRARVLDVLRETPGATLREIAERVGVRSTSSAWAAVNRLIADGRLRAGRCPTCGSKRWEVR